jgi:hypothetical protein
MTAFPDSGHSRVGIGKFYYRLNAAVYNEEKSTIFKQKSRPKGRPVLMGIPSSRGLVARQWPSLQADAVE